MPKVYGVGVYDFRRHRVAEYPVDQPPPPPPPPLQPEKPPPIGSLAGPITLLEIQRDHLTRVAAANWGTTATERDFKPELVKEIYETELMVTGRGRKTVPLHRVMILEVSQYLENYLWPNFDPDSATFEHVMSMILMVNEKFRENVSAWVCFHERKEAFKGFLWRVLRLKEEHKALSMAEKTNYLLFMINAFQSLEDEIVSKTVLQLVSLRLWHSLSFGRFQMELCLNPQLIRKWRRMIKRETKEAAKRGEEAVDFTNVLEVKFLRDLIEEFLEILDSKVMLSEPAKDSMEDQVDESCVLYCERFMEFLIDLLSQLPTRRFLRPLVADVGVVAKCHLSTLYTHEKGRLFAQLVDLLQFYEGFEINDHDGTQLSDDEVLLTHYNRLQAFQLLAFKQVPKLRDFSLYNIGAINKRADLMKKLLVLSDEELRELVCKRLKLISEEDPCSPRRDFLMEVMVSYFEKRQSQKEAINALPLYPNEQIMWDESLVPSINYSGEGCLALPKLNLQFLTLHDYLLRNFNLFRLESTYEIREDIQEAVPHLLAYINNEGETAFRGWSRMAVPVNQFKITEVKQPNIGEVKPAAVTANVAVSIASYRYQIRSEWDALKEHDVLFLLSIRPTFEPLSADEADKSTVPERLGLQFVRGCEVIEIRDEEGNLMNDFTGRVKREEWKPPKGDMRTITVALDPAQYHLDTTEKGSEDIYGSFNILMRRKPKENNFKAILESIRDLMNETCLVPDWLHKLFLGYGHPSSAQWVNMPHLLDEIDFKDTFLDAEHLRECFPNYEVSFVNSDGTENTSPCAPFRIKLPESLKQNTNALPGNSKPVNEEKTAEKEKLVNEGNVAEEEKLVNEENTAEKEKLVNEGNVVEKEKLVNEENTSEKEKLVNEENTAEKEKFANQENTAEKQQSVNGETIAEKEKSVNEENIAEKEKSVNEENIAKKEKLIDEENIAEELVDEENIPEKETLVVEAYIPADPGPYPQDKPKQNSVRFTPTQIGAIISGVQPGLTMVVGPPGTGKTDTAVQILNVLYHNCPSQRTLIITHSNQALNDLFEKIMQRDVPARYLLRLGQGEQELATDLDFSRQGRVNAMLVRRLELLREVERLAVSLRLPPDSAHTCEAASYFWLLHVYSRWERFLAEAASNKEKAEYVRDHFPFSAFFENAPEPVFTGESFERDMRAAKGCFRHLSTIFQELEECRAFELLKSTADRANYLMTKQAKIVAMTCTHAALKRKDFLQLGFKYDNLLMEESAQILEIETFIPMLLQRQEDGHARLKRCILIGDHHQLPPVVKNMAFQKYSHMDQSLFTRFVRLGVPYIELNAQGRARSSIAKLYNWRYRELGDLPNVREEPIFHKANSGFSYEYQLVDVPDYMGRGESAPSPWFYQNEGEAEYVVSVYMYMRSLGYPAARISILTTYNGQKLLIRDVINRRCKAYGIEPPSKVATVDKFQGQQNDFILLSLVRTRFVGHLRDVRRLIVAMSRARLGMYIFCRRSLFEQCFELQPTFRLLLQRPDKLALNLQETTPFTDRPVGVTGMVRYVEGVEDMEQLVSFRMHQLYQMQMMNQQKPVEELPPDQDGPAENGVEDTEMPLASNQEPEPDAGNADNDTEMSSACNGEPEPEREREPEPQISDNVAQGDASADDTKMEE